MKAVSAATVVPDLEFRRHVASVVLALVHASGILAFAWSIHTAWLHATAIPLALWMGYLLLRHPSESFLLSAYVLPLTLEQPEAGWTAWLSTVPLIALGARSLFMLAWDKSQLLRWLRRPATLLGMLWCVAMMVSAASSDTPAKALEQALRSTAPWLGIWVVLQSSADPDLLAQWWRRYSLALMLVLGYALVLSPFQPKASANPFLAGDNQLAGALLPVILLLPVGAHGRGRLYVRWVLAGALLAWAAWISRGALLGCLGGILVLGMLWPMPRVWRIGLGLLLALALVAVLVPRQKSPLPSETDIFAPKHSFSNEERMMRWELARRIWLDHPALGLGPGCYAPAFKHYLENDDEVKKIAYWHGWKGGAHNLVLGSLAETGLIGTLLMLGWMVWGMAGRVRAALARDKAQIALLAAAVAMLVHLMVEDLLLADACAAAWMALMVSIPRKSQA